MVWEEGKRGKEEEEEGGGGGVPPCKLGIWLMCLRQATLRHTRKGKRKGSRDSKVDVAVVIVVGSGSVGVGVVVVVVDDGLKEERVYIRETERKREWERGDKEGCRRAEA